MPHRARAAMPLMKLFEMALPELTVRLPMTKSGPLAGCISRVTFVCSASASAFGRSVAGIHRCASYQGVAGRELRQLPLPLRRGLLRGLDLPGHRGGPEQHLRGNR